MGNTKKRLAVFLNILFILPSILAVLPQTSEEVQAGPRFYMTAMGGLFTSSSGGAPPILMVEADQQFHIGDYMKLWVSDNGHSFEVGTVSMQKASYSSSNKSIATVNSKGLVSTKTEGSTNIKLKYKGGTGTFELRVMEKGSFGEKESYTKVRKALAKLMKNMPSKVTSKNAFQMIKKIKAYQAVCDQVSISTSGAKGGNYKLVVPQAGRFNMYQQMLNVYAQNNSPLATTSSKVLKVDSVKASKKKIEVKLKKAPTTDQFLSMKIRHTIMYLNPYPEENRSAAKNKVYFHMYFTDKKGMQKAGLACMTKGSKTITVTPLEYKDGKLIKGKLEKGTYRLGSKYQWTKGKKFKVK